MRSWPMYSSRFLGRRAGSKGWSVGEITSPFSMLRFEFEFLNDVMPLVSFLDGLLFALISIGKDPIARQRMGQCAKKRLHRFFTAEVMVQKTEEIYRKLVADQS